MTQPSTIPTADAAPADVRERLILEGGRRHVLIEGVTPEIDAGRFPIKRVPGESIVVEADVFAAGHDQLSVILKSRRSGETAWSEALMEPLVNDRWRGTFTVRELGTYFYTVEAWVDPYKTWRHDLLKRVQAGQDLTVELVIGAQLVEAASRRATGDDSRRLFEWAKEFTADTSSLEGRTQRALDEELAALTMRHPDRRDATVYSRELRVTVDPVLARTGAWYELFPRSCPGKKGPHGTFQDVENHLPKIAEMGFDVLYLPPIHPIGVAFRKGKNNNPVCEPGEPGSPWGVGSAEGGHKAIHPELGTLADFQRLLARARALKIEIALDIAFQCSPDHPWVTDHPDWFKQRPDGTIQYAENPPKKYQDIYPINFESHDWRNLWLELKSVIDYWIGHGVRVFRVDNPHTKTLPFWEWVIGEIRQENPEVIFLSEAFTRPRIMYGLAKLGFNQSYNYFPWRNSRWELTEYLTELTRTQVSEYFRANLWPNTPDILPHYLQQGGWPGAASRLVLAATLGSSYGIYGPAYEMLENQPLKPGGEEYLNSEKYEIRDWHLEPAQAFTDLITRVNRIRRENPALHLFKNLHFHYTDNEALIAYSKATPTADNVILVIVNLDFRYAQSGFVHLALNELGVNPWSPFRVHDLLTDAVYQWHGDRNYISLRPWDGQAHIFRVTPL